MIDENSENLIDNILEEDKNTDYTSFDIGYENEIKNTREELTDTLQQTYSVDYYNDENINLRRKKEEEFRKEKKRKVKDFYGYTEEDKENESFWYDYVSYNPIVTLSKIASNINPMRAGDNFFHGGNWTGDTTRFAFQKIEMLGLNDVDKDFTNDKKEKMINEFEGLNLQQKIELYDYKNEIALNTRASQFMKHNDAKDRMSAGLDNNIGYSMISFADASMLLGGWGGAVVGARLAATASKGVLTTGAITAATEGVLWYGQEKLYNMIDEDKTNEEMLNNSILTGVLAGTIGMFSRNVELKAKRRLDTETKLREKEFEIKETEKLQKQSDLKEDLKLKQEERKTKKTVEKTEELATKKITTQDDILDEFENKLIKESEEIIEELPKVKEIRNSLKADEIKKKAILKEIEEECVELPF